MKLNYKRTFFIGLAFLSICSFWQIYDNEIPLILKNVFGMKETLTGVIMAFDNILAIFLLPFFGSLSDRTRTRLGRRTPFIAAGTVCAVTAFMLLSVAVQNKNLIFFLCALGAALVAMSSYRSPAVALMPDLTEKPLRSRANAVINLMGTVGALFALIAIKLLPGDGKYGYIPLFAAVSALMIISVAVLMLTINENRLAAGIEHEDSEGSEGSDENPVKAVSAPGEKLQGPVKRSMIFLLLSVFLWYMAYNAVTTAFSRYTGEVWGKGGSYANYLMIAIVAATAAYFPIGIVSSRIGRKNTILIGVLLMFAAFASGYFFLSPSFAVYVLFAAVGIGWAAINVNSYPMVVEMVHSGSVGRYTGIYYIFSMAAQIVTPVFSGFLIEKTSYRILFPYATVFAALAFVTMLFVRHGDAAPEKAKKEARS